MNKTPFPSPIIGIALALILTCITAMRDRTVKPHLETRDRMTVCIAPRVTNMRDLGGWRTTDGQSVRKGRIYRSAALNASYTRWYWPNWNIPADSRRFLVDELGIRTDLDLRKTNEVGGVSQSPLGPSVSWRNIPGLAYEKLGSEAGRKAFAEAFAVFLDEANYPILFHCKAGRDRAGSLAFILNALLGVCEEDLVYDWKYTWLAKGEAKDETERLNGLMAVINAYPGKTLQERTKSYVRSVGFTDHDIATFRNLMLDQAPQ